MQVLHLSTSHTGGAGIAARRLHKSLLKNGVKSKFLTLENQNFVPSPSDIVLTRNLFARLLSKATSFLSAILYRNTYFSLISYSNLTARKLKKFGVDQKTILHLHNWFNLLNHRSLENLLKRGFNVVITLHDERFFTGGCHYALQCSRFSDCCSHCPLISISLFRPLIRKNHRRMKSLMAKYNQQLTFIAPSQWIMNQANKSSILQNSFVIHQPNIHEEFELEFKKLTLNSFGKANQYFNIGVASLDSTSPLKGSDLIPAILSKLKQKNFKFNLLELVQFPKTQTGYMQFWQNIECLLVLSRADNSPNVIHEANIAGVPIIATSVGGIPEIIDPRRDFLFNLDDCLIDKVCSAIIELATRETGVTRISRDPAPKDKSLEPIRVFLEIYSRMS